MNETTSALIQELELRKEYLGDQKISTIYFGGGTPSMLPPEEIQQLIESVYDRFACNSDLEITMEANPDNLTSDYLQKLKVTDVNRFSIGIQSYFEEELKWMNRAHNAIEANACVDLCRSYGYKNFNIDLIFGIPVSDNKKWQQNLQKTIALNPHHISCYALTVEEGTALSHFIKVGKSPKVIDKSVEEQFYLAHDILQNSGYVHYEISNYALPGKESKHNSSYWEGAHYLGIGPGAHSFDGKSRSWNIEHLPKYLKAIESNDLAIETEALTKNDQFNEWIMTGLRKKEGLSWKALDKYFPSYRTHVEAILPTIPISYLEFTDQYFRLSRNGLVFADFVGSELFVV